jgi:hypothetical protein
MTWMKTSLREKALVLFAAMALLILALSLAACGSSGAGASSNNNDGNSNISTSQQSTSNSGSSSSSGSSGNIQSADQQVQNAIQGVDGAHNDTNNADATATTENNTPQQP